MRNDFNIADEFATMVAAKVVDILEEKGLVIADNASCSKEQQTQTLSTALYSINEVCERVKISKATLNRHRKCGYITPSCYVGRTPRFSEVDIDKYLRIFNSEK